MTKDRTSNREVNRSGSQARAQLVSREHAGKWIAWSEDGLRIVAVAESFDSCEQAATHAGFLVDQIAIERVPKTRFRVTGSGM